MFKGNTSYRVCARPDGPHTHPHRPRPRALLAGWTSPSPMLPSLLARAAHGEPNAVGAR
jgi:hypothetical protein